MTEKNRKKEKYEPPKIEASFIELYDILTTSNPKPENPWDDGNYDMNGWV